MAVNRKDIAKHTGLSPSTVGMILSGRGDGYSDATRNKVLTAAEQLNYRPNFAGRSLRLNRSFLVGTLLYTSNWQIATDFLRGTQRTLMSGDYSTIVFAPGSAAEEGDCVQRCLDRHVDGLVVNAIPGPDGTVDMSRYAAPLRAKLPMVEVFGQFLEGVPSVMVDNCRAGRDATEHLLELGHRRIVLLTHSHYDISATNRIGPHFDAWRQYLGYAEAMRNAGLENMVFTHPISGEVDVVREFISGGEEALKAILAHPSRPTAVVCYTDYQAYGLIRAARQLNKTLPDQLSIVGHGNMQLSEIVSPALTTMRLPSYEVGEQALAMLLAMLEGEQHQNELVQAQLIVRESTGRRDP